MNHHLKLLPKGIQSFEIMREGNYTYVDKTQAIYNLITSGRYYFLARPRRFGKSLLVSTFKELFAGNRKLFRGLWIDKSGYKWESHPIIKLSFASMASGTADALRGDLIWNLDEIAKSYSIDISIAPSLQTKFYTLVAQLASVSKSRVVILIDEYDYAILNNINNIEQANACRTILRDFFGVIKDLDEYLQFVFLTGVSKFAKTSIFSGLNNLEDITLSDQAATLLGYTQEELRLYFEPYIKKLATLKRNSIENIISDMKLWYNGYQFTEDTNAKVYNPYSILLFLSSGKLHNYWFETGTPTFLIDLIKKQHFPVTQLDSIEASLDELSTIELEDIPVVTLLFQTGYLTIQSYNLETQNYRLVFPNFEVKSSFFKYLLRKFAKIDLSTINEFALRLTKALKADDIDLFCRLLQTFFADIPSGIQIPELEKYYQTILFILAKVLGLTVGVEVMTNVGRIDMTIEIGTHIYIFEFKVRGTAQEALQQIEDKKYYQKYLFTGKKIVLIGIQFDMKKRNLEDWIIKMVN